jgi:glycosyltransferase domain-containing protein
MAPRLTFVLPLKGRYLYTLRTLWHANKLSVPHRFLFADGQVKDDVALYLENSSTHFPALDVEYIRYPNDSSLSRYFTKVADMLCRVRTPYAMLLDNDDFVGLDAAQWAVDFLDSNPDYVCARGWMTAFAVQSGAGNRYGGLFGKVSHIHSQYITEEGSAPAAADRLRQSNLDLGIYNAVYRTEALATIAREAAEIDFSDLMLHESFYALRAPTLGKIRINPTVVSYYRQVGSSITYRSGRDWARELLCSRFTVDAQALVERVSSAAAATDGADPAPIAEIVRTIIEDYFRWFLWTNYGFSVGLKKHLHKNWPHLAALLQNGSRLFVRRGYSALLSRLARAGASRDDIRRSRAELGAIEGALSQNAFAEYAAPFVAVARADDTRNWF